MNVTSVASKPSIWQALANRRMLICISVGFASGLPLFILLNMLPAWLDSEGINIKTISAFSLTQMPYTWKFLWAPAVDRYSVQRFGRRRTWMLVTQLALIAIIAFTGQLSPAAGIWLPAIMLTLMGFVSATQDIAIDAYRRELLPEEELGIGNSMYVNAYRVAGLVPGSLALILADKIPWPVVFLIVAAFLVPAVITTLLIEEPKAVSLPRNLQQAVVEPFREFIGRAGVQGALLILAFMFLYKLGDAMCTANATLFYLKMGFMKTEIGLVAKNAGLWGAVGGGLLGGIWMVRLGINRALWLFGVVQLVSILGFAWLAWLGPAETTPERLVTLACVIGFEAIGVGLGTAAFVAFISRTTNPAYTATQFALFSSLAAVPRSLVSAYTGKIIESIGWLSFFFLCTLLAIPGMLLLLKVAPWNEPEVSSKAA